jgi:hypothetical protein
VGYRTGRTVQYAENAITNRLERDDDDEGKGRLGWQIDTKL